ncbi:MAG: FecR family protein [Nitrospinota bacterium]
MRERSGKSIAYKLALILFAMILFPRPGFSEQEPMTTLGQLIKTISYSQPENPFIPNESESMSPENLFSFIQTKMSNKGIHLLEGKDMETPLSNLEFLNIVYAFSGGPQNSNLINKKLFLKKNGFISSTDIGLATEIKGSVTQYHQNSSFGKPITLASPLFQFDEIRTERKSRVAFTLDDESRVILGGSTNISMDKNIYNPENRFRKMLFHLTEGMAHFVVSKAMKKGSTFAVVTPNGIAGVRGTEFVTIVEPGGKTRFVVLEGKIETAPILSRGRLGVRTFIGAGEMQTLSEKGRASIVQKAPKKLLDRLQKNSIVKKKLNHPKLLRKSSLPNKKLDSNKRTKKAKTDFKQNGMAQDALKQAWTGKRNPMPSSIDRDTLKPFKNISNPSQLDRFKSNYQKRIPSQALNQMKRQAQIHP